MCLQSSYHGKHLARICLDLYFNLLSSSAVRISAGSDARVVRDSLWDAVKLLHCDELHLFNLAPRGLPGLFLFLGDWIHFCLPAGSHRLSSSEKPRVKQPGSSIGLYWHYTFHSQYLLFIHTSDDIGVSHERVCELTELLAALLCEACVVGCSLTGAVRFAHPPERTCPVPVVEKIMKPMPGTESTFTI